MALVLAVFALEVRFSIPPPSLALYDPSPSTRSLLRGAKRVNCRLRMRETVTEHNLRRGEGEGRK